MLGHVNLVCAMSVQVKSS